MLRRSLGTASVVRWFSVFMLAACVTGLIAWPFFQPFDLIFTQMLLIPGAFVTTVGVFVFSLGIFLWLIRELGRKPIQVAISNSGRKQRDMRIPAAIGVGLIIVAGICTVPFLRGESAERAKSMAEQQVGPGYHFFLSSLQFSKDKQGNSGSGIVTAWNDREIKKISVHREDLPPDLQVLKKREGIRKTISMIGFVIFFLASLVFGSLGGAALSKTLGSEGRIKGIKWIVISLLSLVLALNWSSLVTMAMVGFMS